MIPVSLLGLFVAAPLDVGPAPQDTLNPAARAERLREVFRNCAFQGTQTKQAAKPSGEQYLLITETACTASPEVIVIKNLVHKKDQVIGGKPYPDLTACGELWWEKEKPRRQLDLVVRSPARWPAAKVPAGTVTVEKVAVHPQRNRDNDLVWEQLLVADFVGGPDNIGITFADMLTDGGRAGYKFEAATWVDPSRANRIEYRYTSTDYGTTTATFEFAVGEWRLAEVRLVKTRNHKVAPDEMIGADVRLGNYMELSDFTRPTNGLDRLELAFEVSYLPGGAVPAGLKRTDTRTFKDENSVITTDLKFTSFRAGGVTSDEARKAMFSLPDGTEAFVLDEASRNIAMTTKDGEVIRKIDAGAVDLGRTTSFSTRTRLTLLLAVGLLAVMAAVVLYRRGSVKEVA